MVGIVKEIDGQKKIIPLTTDTGTGAAVGTLIQQYKKVPMSGYLYCDGSTFDENDYPALYMYLGTNVLPDYRECVMVGAEQNTTDTITTHDVYGEGEFKDDQLKRHRHSISNNNSSGYEQYSVMDSHIGFSGNMYTDYNDGGGDTTHGKQKAVYVYIKATSGLAENQQDNVLNDVKEYISPSLVYNTDRIDVYRQVGTYTFQLRGCNITDYQTAVVTVLNGKTLPHNWAAFLSRRNASNDDVFPCVLLVETTLSVSGWYSNSSGIETKMDNTDTIWGSAIIVVVD